jgi:hypothetical protein
VEYLLAVLYLLLPRMSRLPGTALYLALTLSWRQGNRPCRIPTKTPLLAVFMRRGEGHACMDNSYPLVRVPLAPVRQYTDDLLCAISGMTRQRLPRVTRKG